MLTLLKPKIGWLLLLIAVAVKCAVLTVNVAEGRSAMEKSKYSEIKLLTLLVPRIGWLLL